LSLFEAFEKNDNPVKGRPRCLGNMKEISAPTSIGCDYNVGSVHVQLASKLEGKPQCHEVSVFPVRRGIYSPEQTGSINLAFQFPD
jgi:hypothetical protein